MYKRNELERLYRDVRCGGFHPANPLLAHEFIGKMALGIRRRTTKVGLSAYRTIGS